MRNCGRKKCSSYKWKRKPTAYNCRFLRMMDAKKVKAEQIKLCYDDHHIGFYVATNVIQNMMTEGFVAYDVTEAQFDAFQEKWDDELSVNGFYSVNYNENKRILEIRTSGCNAGKSFCIIMRQLGIPYAEFRPQ